MKQHNQQKNLKLWFVIINASSTTIKTPKYHLPSFLYCASKQEKKTKTENMKFLKIEETMTLNMLV